jgi:acetyl-CoA acetyltransferase
VCTEHLILFYVGSHCYSPDKGGPTQTEEIANHYPARDCPKPMGWTSENVAMDFAITRDEMDGFAAQSYQKAERAQKAGYFDREIVPFMAYKANSSGTREKVLISKDDGIRYNTTKDSLLKIRAAFPQWGNALTTGGNASQITDGAAAVLLMSRRKAKELGLSILAKFISTAVTGNMIPSSPHCRA